MKHLPAVAILTTALLILLFVILPLAADAATRLQAGAA